MRKGKKLTFLVTILCTLALLMGMFGISSFAATAADDASNKVTATTSATVKQGNTGYCYVYIDSLESLSSLNVAVHYDPDKISVTRSFNQVSCSLYDSSITESYVQYSYIFDGKGEGKKTQLFYFEYNVLRNAEVGGAYFDIVVSEAYDSSLNVANVSGSRCSFTIAEKVTNKTCSISGNSSVSTSIKQEFELSYRLNTTSVASGSFVIRYDAEIFEFMELTVGGLLNNKFYDVKTDQLGAIFVSFVGTEYSNNSGLLNVKFKTIKNVTETSQIKLSVTDFYDLDLNSIGCNGYTTNANITFDSTYSENAPSMMVTPVYSAENNKVTLTIKLDKNSYLGAGDFVLNFNTDYFTYNSYTKEFSPTFFNVNDKKVSEGVLKFSIISLSDIMIEETVLTVTFDTPVFCNDVIADFDIGGSGLSDSLTNPILINFVDSSLSISGVGHDLISHPAQDPTCTEIGWYAYETCSRCDYTTYEAIPANGHSYVHTFCSVCNEKQPVYRSWDVSASGDGSVMANLYENVVDGGYELEIAGSGAMADWNSASNVPWYSAYRSQINYLMIEDGITTIGARAFYGCTVLTSAAIPNNVETIGDYAFYGCTNLSSITFGNSIKKIGDCAFYGCSSLSSVSLPNSVETIEGYAFYNCSKLSDLSLGTSIATIGSYVFGNCSVLERIAIPETVTIIGNGAFANCYLVNEVRFNATAMNDLEYNNNVFFNAGINGEGIAVTIGANVTKIPAYLFYSTSNGTDYLPKVTSVTFANGSVCASIGSYAFYYVDEITSIVLPNTLKSIGNYAFAYCYALTSADLGNSVETIESNAFYYCTALESVDLGNAVVSIGSSAFYNCYVLESISIPESVTTIGGSAFYNCKTLTEIIFDAAEMADLSNNNYVFYNAGIDGDGVAVRIGANVTKIPAYLFYATSNNTSYNPKITSIIFEDDSACKTIGTYAFAYGKNFEQIILPESVETIGDYAFYYCSNLLRVQIPSSVTSIGYYAFINCPNIVFAFGGEALPASLSSSWRSSDTIYHLNAERFVVVNEAMYIIFNDGTAALAKYYGSESEYTILDKVDNVPVVLVGKNAFRSNTALQTIVIPDTVTKIDEYAFYGCSALLEVQMGAAVKTIGTYAFAYCSALTEVRISDSVESINSNAFYYCTALESVYIGESVKTIGASAFSNCTVLTEIQFNAVSMNDLVSNNSVFYNAGINGDGIDVTIGSGVTKIPAYLFYSTTNSTSYLPKITTVVFESGSVCESVGNYAFYYADELVSINLPVSIETIGTYTFYNCYVLSSITIPESVTTIGSYAFYNCKALTEIIFNATEMIDLSNNNYVFYYAGVDGDGIAVRIGANVKKIPAYLFHASTNNSSYLPKIISVEFANGSVCESIGSYAFYYSDDLASINLPDTIETIGTYAFAYCSSLTSITIPASVTDVGTYAFYSCAALTAIEFNAIAMDDLSSSNCVFYNAGVNGEGISVTIGASVTKISAYLFYPYDSSCCPNITSVTFANGSVCESIGAYAFYYADSVTSIELPDTVKSIGNYAFAYCYALTSADLGNSVQTVGSNAFYYCTALESVNFGESVTTIGSSAFYNCTALESVNVSEVLTTIGSSAFSNCTALTSITIPETVTSIGNYAFNNCTSLAQINFNAASMNDLVNNNYVFYNAGVNTDGINVWVGDKVAKIPAYLFYSTSNNSSYLPKITSVAFEEGSVCGSIGAYAFYYSSNLLRILIPNTVSEIGAYAFYGCSKAVIAFDAEALPTTGSNWYSSEATYYLNAKQFIAINEALYVILDDNTATFAKYYGEATEYQVLDAVEGVTVTAIGSNAFRNNTTIESVTIPDAVTQINAYAFYGCSALKSITIPKNITAIGKSAFYNCTNVEEIAFNAISMDDLAYENYVFYNNGKNTEGISVTIGAEVTKIPAYLFRSAHDDSYNPKITSIVFAENSVCESIGGCSFYGLDYLTTIIIPESVTSIASHAMSYCSKLTIGFEAEEAPETLGSYWNADSGYYLNVKEFVIYDDATYVITNDGKAILGRYVGTAAQYEIFEEVNSIAVTAIGDYAFYQNKTLDSVDIPSNVTSVGNNAFYYCTAMTDVVLPNGLLIIGNNAFYSCSALTTILIPETVTNIGSSAFNSCSKLTIGFASETQNATLGSSWSGDSGYYLNVKEFVVYDEATYVVTNDNTAALGRYYGTATEYAILESVNGASVTIVGKGAFRNVSSLVNVSIPNTVTRIENNAFYYCTSLESITIPENVVYIGNNAFYYTRALTEINFNAIAVNNLSSSNYVFCYSGQDGDGIKVTIGAQVTKISNYLFYPRSSATYLPKITEFVFEEGSVCKIIGAYTFAYNTNLSSIILPEGVEVIGSYAFANTNIETIVIPDSVTTINSYAFNNCANLATVHMPSALTSIGAYAFYNCSLLSEIVIPEGVTTIDSCAFQNVGFKLVYICSDKIAYNANSSSACGYLLDGVSSVVIRSDIELISNYIAENYTNIEAITYQGSDYVIYSVHEHSWSEHQVLVPYIACEQDGCIRYVCSDCGAYKDVTTFKHDVIINAAKEPDCTNVGWHEYHTCSKCDYTTYTEIPALGHRVLIDGRVWVDSIATENDSTYPFILKDGIYSSTNHSDYTDSYFKITALYDCTLNISYAVSSEQNFDKIIIRRNGTIVVEISGQVDWTSTTIELTAGDIVTINYHKDTSVSVGEDTGWFSFTCEQTQIGALVPGPAADAEPTCTEAVVCHFCQTLIKEALGHDEVSHSAKAPTCTEIGWNAYVTCSRCDYTTYVEIPANGHSYGEWIEILAPTCTVVGTERRDCDDCDHYETRDIAVLGHNEINHDAKASTCTEIGWHAYVTCSRCDYTTYVEIAALGHDEIGHSAKEPTCTAIGWYEYVTCSRCDYTTYVERAVLGHDTINHEAQAPTCTEIGWYAYDTCARCSYTTYVEIAATGHNYVRTNCSVCGEAQPAINTWDISSDGSNGLIAKIYRNYVEGGYELVISGSGAMADYEYNEPWSNYRGSITRVELPNGLTSIGNRAFYSCTSLRQITIPESVELIGKYAFAYSGNLVIAFESDELPNVADYYWNQGCGYYLAPQKVIVTDDATYVIDSDGNACLAKYVGNATEFTPLDSVEGISLTRIGQFAFYNKDNLHTYWIADNISYIGREAFYGCNALAILLESNELPAYTGSNWNRGCSYYLGAETWVENDFLFVRDKDNKVDLIRYQGTSQEVTIPVQAGDSQMQSIRQYAFYQSQVKHVIIPEGIQVIGDNAFYGCSSLQSIQLPQSLLTIGIEAFYNCYSLSGVVLPENLTSIGRYAFWYCRSIKSIIIPQNVTTLYGTFVGCSELETIILHDDITRIEGMTFYSCTSLKEIQLPKNLQYLASSAFDYCYDLHILEIPEKVHNVSWNSAFGSTTLNVLYICSPKLAATITESAWSAEVFQTLKTIVVPAGSGTTYLQSVFAYCETIYRDGVAYDVYSLNAHSWKSEVIEEFAICQNDGVILYTCENCGVEKVEITLCHDKIHHDAKAPNCTEIGWNAYETCSRCDYTTYVEIPANGHSYGDWEVVLDPTCTMVGTERRDCNDCEHYETRDVAVLGHDLLHHSAKEVTCTNIGWNAFDTCSRCDYTTYVEIPATGHTYDNWIETKAPTCLTKGTERRDCHCGHFETRDVAALGHDIVHHNAQAVTCTVIGWDAYDTCSRCDYTTYVEIPATGHTASDWIIDAEATYEADGSKHKECTVCHTVLETSTIPMLTHSYVAVVTPPTCTEQGYTTHTCSDCGKSYVDDYVPATGHDYGAWVQILAPKCEAVGTDRRDCTICDHYETRDISATGHTESEWIVDLNATCTIGGSKHIECTVCEKTLETEVITKLGHNEIVHTAKAPTCTEIGWSMYVTCSRCDYSTYTEIPANGHTYGEWIAEVPAECESEGTLGHYHCGACNTNYDINHNILATLVIPETGHAKSDWIVDVESICTADGIRHKECTVCGKVLETAVIPMLGHDTVQHSAKVPTCTEIGWDAYEVCTRCIYTTYIEKPANGHDYGSFIAEIPATCEEEGTLGYYHCSVCGCNFDIDKNILLELVIAATGHTESGWIVDANATCTFDGSKHIECTVCEKTLRTETIVKLGHSELIHSSKAPTCTEIGWHAYVTCSRCDYTTYVEIPAKGHSYGIWEVILDPTCTALGTECRGCNNCEYYETRDVAALGHDEVNHDAKAPTCTEIGWDAYVTCSRCDYSTYAEKKALGHDKIDHEAKAPICTEIGWKAYVTCSRCDYTTYVEIPANGHSMGECVVTKKPTCTTIGMEQRNCKNCDYFETRDVVSLGHDEVNHDAKAPTCTEIGWNAYATCSRCDYTTYVEIPATGHTAGDWIIDVEATYEVDGSKHKECTVCGEILETSIIPMLKHSYESIVTPPTCTARGYTTHTCRDCGDVYIDDYVDAAGHTYGDWIQILAPKCEAVGTERRDCEKCEHYEIRDISATGHKESEWIIDLSATCTVNGSKHIECTVCEKTLKTAEITKLGHEYGSEWTIDKESNCIESGSKSYHCSRCSERAEITEIAPIGHVYGEWVTSTAPTCTDGGQERRDCENCDHFETRDVAAFGHDTVSHPAQSATCTDIGWNAYETCLRCDYTTYVEIPANGHSYGDWTETKAPTCTENGEKAKECSVCHNVVTEVVDKLGHDEVTHDAQMASCEQIGWNAYVTCSRCDYTTYAEIPKLNHSMGDWTQTTAPSCLEKGEECRYCNNCKYYETRKLAALNHNRVEYEAKAPTCKEIGWNAYVACSRCDYTTYEEIPELGHDEVSHEAKAPMCMIIGWNEYVTCTRCDYTTYEEIPASGHSYSEVQTVAATCTEAGYIYHDCEVCGHEEILSTIEVKGHTASEWIVDVEAKEGVAGKRHKECTVCGEKLDEEDIPALPVSSKGCGSTITGISFGSIGLLSVVGFLFMRKRKKS